MSNYEILHLIDHLGLGGAQRIVADLVDNNNQVLSMRKKDTIVDLHHSTYTEVNRTSKYNLRCFYDSYCKVKNNDINILHCHLLKSKIVGLFLNLLFRNKLKLIFHEHGRLMNQNWPYKIFLFCSKYIVDQHIVVSKTLKLYLEELNVPKKEILVKHNYVDLENFNSFEAQKRSLEDEIKVEVAWKDIQDNFILGFGGRIVSRKGWRTLIKAMDLLDNNFVLIIVGEGPESSKLQQKIAGKNQIYYLGYIKDVRNFYGSIDCLILPSKREGCPMMLFEAQSSKTPIISSSINSINEIIEHGYNGLLFECGNFKELAERIKELKEDSHLKNKLQNNGLEFVQNYNSKSYNKDINRVYESLYKD